MEETVQGEIFEDGQSPDPTIIARWTYVPENPTNDPEAHLPKPEDLPTEYQATNICGSQITPLGPPAFTAFLHGKATV